jgi:hypothetical protein
MTNKNYCTVIINHFELQLVYPFVRLSVPRYMPVNHLVDWSSYGVSELDEFVLQEWLLEN